MKKIILFAVLAIVIVSLITVSHGGKSFVLSLNHLINKSTGSNKASVIDWPIPSKTTVTERRFAEDISKVPTKEQLISWCTEHIVGSTFGEIAYNKKIVTLVMSRLGRPNLPIDPATGLLKTKLVTIVAQVIKNSPSDYANDPVYNDDQDIWGSFKGTNIWGRPTFIYDGLYEGDAQGKSKSYDPTGTLQQESNTRIVYDSDYTSNSHYTIDAGPSTTYFPLVVNNPIHDEFPASYKCPYRVVNPKVAGRITTSTFTEIKYIYGILLPTRITSSFDARNATPSYYGISPNDEFLNW